MTDIADEAQVYEQQRLARAIARATKDNGESPFDIEGVRVCLDCFEPIEAERLAANPRAVRCVEHQEIAEKKARGFQRGD